MEKHLMATPLPKLLVLSLKQPSNLTPFLLPRNVTRRFIAASKVFYFP